MVLKHLDVSTASIQRSLLVSATQYDGTGRGWVRKDSTNKGGHTKHNALVLFLQMNGEKGWGLFLLKKERGFWK